TISISDFVRAIKANSSRWIKGINPRYKNFSWQAGYGAFSVSESIKESVTSYILNQKEHHKKVSAYDEFMRFLEKNGLMHAETDEGK
ncbi:MAG: transposase, partial [Akkermansiaceae bacterium]|nr:transposase [Akkermansiaceae bacterium]